MIQHTRYWNRCHGARELQDPEAYVGPLLPEICDWQSRMVGDALDHGFCEGLPCPRMHSNQNRSRFDHHFRDYDI